MLRIRTLGSNVTLLAVSASAQIRVLPNTYSIAGGDLVVVPNKGRAPGQPCPGAIFWAVAMVWADALKAEILLRGMMVTRFRSLPSSQQLGTRHLCVDDDIVEPATGANLQSGPRTGVLLVQGEAAALPGP